MRSFRHAVLCASLAAPALLGAQSSTYAPFVLTIPASVRALSMGNVGVVSRDDDVLFYNPAQLAIARGMSMSAERFSPTTLTGALSSVTRLATGGIAVGAIVADFAAPPGYPVDRSTVFSTGPAHGTSTGLVVGAAQVIKNFRIGAAAKYVEDRVDTVRNGRAAFDLGLGRDFFGYSFGLAVQNIGSSYTPPQPIPSFGTPIPLSNVRMPLRTTFGVGHSTSAGPFDIAATAAASLIRVDFFSPAAGAEIGYSWLDGYNILLRAGVRRPAPGEGSITAGAGFVMDRLSIDYAIEAATGSHIAHRLGFRIR